MNVTSDPARTHLGLGQEGVLVLVGVAGEGVTDGLGGRLLGLGLGGRGSRLESQ
jgi:hypothetical protein